ncbi:hypothetical protein F4678DRAFT_4642 [Xylaria arbuscula]|nr:hypothetical protein F4678DRAFT_4642 [Xylaria arbuscula]
MSFTLRTLARRASVLQPQIKRQAVPPASVLKRGYVSAHSVAENTSDLPWLIGAVGVTGVGLAFILSGNKASPAHHEGGHSKEEQAHPPKPSSSDSEPQSPDDKPEGDNSAPKGAADPSSPGKSSQGGQNVPPPAADSSDLAENWDEKKEGHEELKTQTRGGETKAATSSSATPSKKTASEDPREDPQKGEGEGVQKGSSRD